MKSRVRERSDHHDPAARQRLEKLLENFAAEFTSIEILKASVHRERGEYVLSLQIDREDGVDTTLCEQVSRIIDLRAEALGSSIGPYSIEVASAGLDRPLLNAEHFRRFIGREARIITRFPIAKRVEFTGRIESSDGVSVRLADRYAGAVDIPHQAIKKAHLTYEPSEDLHRKSP
jgi:ribosome maturation factor RimP